MILDSDIIIYSALPERKDVKEFIFLNSPYVSAVSRVEVLGFQRLSEVEIEYFESFFDSSVCLVISDDVIDQAIRLRRQHKINLGDSLIAASAIVNGLSLVTNNTKDFNWIGGLKLINPLQIT